MSLYLTTNQNSNLHDMSISSHYAEQPEPKPLFVLSRKVKFIVFVPESHSDIVRKVIGAASGGIIGNYKNCSFTTKGIARFTEIQSDSSHADDTVSMAKEERIETVVPIHLLADLIKKVRAVHPYKEMGYDIYPLIEVPPEARL